MLGTAEFEEGGWITLERVQRLPSGVELLLQVRSDFSDFERQAWRVACNDVRAWQLRAEPVYDVELLTEHVLLSPYTELRSVLAIRGPAHDPRHAIADLLARHGELAGSWIPFATFFNPNLPIVELLGMSGGILAEAPESFAAAYSEVLPAHGIEPYTVRTEPALRWGEHGWEPERRDVQLLLLAPNDFVIGAGFAAERVPIEHLPHGA